MKQITEGSKKRNFKIVCLILAVAAVSVFLCLLLRPKAGIYEETLVYGNEHGYMIKFYGTGRYQITDILERGNKRIYTGKYSIYDSPSRSRLVLTSDNKDWKLVFQSEGEDWVYCKPKSHGYENSVFEQKDRSVWTVW